MLKKRSLVEMIQDEERMWKKGDTAVICDIDLISHTTPYLIQMTSNEELFWVAEEDISLIEE